MQSKGLREKKFERTRASLIDNAVELCLTAGYENATVDRIAATADISPRTFSRYFAARDDVFLAVMEPLSDAVFGELQSQVDETGPLEALRSAHVAVLTRIADRPYGTPSADQLVTVLRVVSSSETLRWRAVERCDPRLLTTLAERMRVSVNDQRLGLALTLFNLAVVTGWANLAPKIEPTCFSPRMMVDEMQAVLDDVVAVVAGLDAARWAGQLPSRSSIANSIAGDGHPRERCDRDHPKPTF